MPRSAARQERSFLDLCELDFLDSSGLRVMLRARARLAREDRELAIFCPPGSVRRLFEVVGIADLLFFNGSREDAAAELVPADLSRISRP